MEIKEYIANIYFLKSSEGGRKSDIINKDFCFRPLLHFDYKNYHVQIDFEGIELIKLGCTYKLKLRVIDLCPLEKGSIFELKEINTIGTGEIIKVIL